MEARVELRFVREKLKVQNADIDTLFKYIKPLILIPTKRIEFVCTETQKLLMKWNG